MKSQLAEVQTGFEPLFFHIQADFQWQRPFSEGRDDRFSEKTKKNLSQSYGRWIVGFHEPMTSAFFALKKGATDWRLEMSEENAPQKERYLREVEQKLLHTLELLFFGIRERRVILQRKRTRIPDHSKLLV